MMGSRPHPANGQNLASRVKGGAREFADNWRSGARDIAGNWKSGASEIAGNWRSGARDIASGARSMYKAGRRQAVKLGARAGKYVDKMTGGKKARRLREAQRNAKIANNMRATYGNSPNATNLSRALRTSKSQRAAANDQIARKTAHDRDMRYGDFRLDVRRRGDSVSWGSTTPYAIRTAKENAAFDRALAARQQQRRDQQSARVSAQYANNYRPSSSSPVSSGAKPSEIRSAQQMAPSVNARLAAEQAAREKAERLRRQMNARKANK